MALIKKKWVETPNQGERSEKLKYIILHCTEMANDAEAIAWWCDPEKEISPHYFIDANAQVYQFVEEEKKAWHAGVSKWGQDENLNNSSIGIEISNLGEGKGQPYTEEQYQTLILLLQEIMGRHHIQPQNVLAHSDIAPSRKQDPGSHFDWKRLYDLNLADKSREITLS